MEALDRRLLRVSDRIGKGIVAELAQDLIHFAIRLVLVPGDDFRRDAGDSRVLGNRLKHHGARRDARESADFDIAEDFCSGADQHAATDFRVAVAGLLAGAAERDILQNRNIVFDHRRRADDEAGRMIEKHALPYARRRMNVGLEQIRGAALQIEGEVPPTALPEVMRQAVGLERVITLEIEEGFNETVAGGVAAPFVT